MWTLITLKKLLMHGTALPFNLSFKFLLDDYLYRGEEVRAPNNPKNYAGGKVSSW
jgi:hypothetical protein